VYRLREFPSVPDIFNSDLDYGLYLIKKDLFEMGKILSIFDLSASVHD